MAKQESAFQLKHIEETAAIETSGLLEQLNLPPALADFIRKYQRLIWIAVSVVAAAVIIVSLYGSYRSYTLNKAAEAYDRALLLDDEQKKAALEQVADKYGSTPSSIWSRVELAHMDQAAQDYSGALEKLTAIKSSLKENSLLLPLILVNMGGLYEQENQSDKALAVYQELKTLKGFEAEAVKKLALVYEARDEKEKAIEMYQQYLDMTAGKQDAAPQPDDPARALIRASLNRLQQ